MAYTRDNVLTLEDFAKLPTSTVWSAIDEAYNAGTNPFRAAGVLTNSPLISRSLNDGEGIRTEVQAWNDLEYVESNVSNDDPEDHATPLKMDTKLWSAVRTHRNVGVSGMNLVQDFAAQDPLAVLSGRVANYKNTDEVTHLFAVLNGLIAGDATAQKFTYTMDAGSTFDIREVLKAVQETKGDNAGVVTTIGMSSARYLDLQLANVIDNVPASQTDVSFRTIGNGRFKLAVDDRFGNNLVGLGNSMFHFGTAPQSRKSVAVQSVEDAGNGSGQETIWFRWKTIVHPMGFNYNGTFAAKGGPSFAELNAANAYTLASEAKKLPLVIIKAA
ncbi:hypothetical protein [Sphingobium yanoikuyae]|uniref:hypothetical protein n=1 Tax=Sphingobium yanoikuyae TaxID=13690 RepID=UPI0028ADC3DC|nr:hypothetical protein [Sphingobium yanoikuyae]